MLDSLKSPRLCARTMAPRGSTMQTLVRFRQSCYTEVAVRPFEPDLNLQIGFVINSIAYGFTLSWLAGFRAPVVGTARAPLPAYSCSRSCFFCSFLLTLSFWQSLWQRLLRIDSDFEFPNFIYNLIHTAWPGPHSHRVKVSVAWDVGSV